jgi:hypothetical protein
MSSSAEKKHMGRVAGLPCAVCGSTPVEVHHILEGRTPGRRAPPFLTIPLCPSCHRDNHNGIHGQRRMWNVMKKTELLCLNETLEALYGE